MIRKEFFVKDSYEKTVKFEGKELNQNIDFSIPPDVLIGILDKVSHFNIRVQVSNSNHIGYTRRRCNSRIKLSMRGKFFRCYNK